MIFPKNKMRILDSFDGRPSEEGWLELDLKTVDLDGVSKIQINLDDLESLKSGKSKASDALNQAKKLLGG